MLTPDDRHDIDELIAARLDAEGIVKIFTSMDERQKEELAGHMSRYMVDRAQALRKPENYYTPQWRKAGQDINYTSPTEFYQANVAGHAGPTLPRAINLQGANWESWISANNPEELNLRVRGGGGADCMFDWIVSSCWAAEVTAGRGTEGQLFTSLSGCTFYVTSTVQQAWDGVGTGVDAGLKEDTGAQVCYICPGDAGPLTISGDSANSGLGVRFIGSGEASRIEASGTGTGAAGTALSVSGGGSRPLTFQMLSIGAETLTRAFNLTDGSSCYFFDCFIGHESGYPPLASDATGQQIHALRTTFLVNGAAQYALDGNGNGNDSTFVDCTFSDRVRPGSEFKFKTCRFNLGVSGIGIDATNAANVWAEECEFRSSGSSFTSYISCDGVTGGKSLHIVGCYSTVGATQAILIADGYLANGTATQQITGNDWACALGLNQTGTDLLEGINYSGNAHSHVAQADSAFIYASGKFRGCVFDGNGSSMGYVSFTAGSTFNRVNGVQVSTGAPTHIAAEGQEYWDLTANTMYVNTGGSTTWAVLGVAGGGAAAPSPHNLVSVHHDGEQDYTNTLGLLGLGVGTGDLIMYSDAGITAVGTWDAATGHVTLGSASAPSTGVIIQSSEQFTDPAEAKYAFNTSIAMLMTAGNAFAFTGSFSRLRARGSFTASGLWVSYESDIFRTSDSPVINDYRGFYAIATGGAGLTIVDRYGLYVADGIGAGVITNQYGVYIENMAKGGTLNRAIQSLGGLSTHLGAIRFGSNTAPTNVTNGDVTAARLIVPDGTLVATGIVAQLGAIGMPETAAPGTPSADAIVVYNETNTDQLRMKDDTGAVNLLSHKHVFQAILDSTVVSTSVPYAMLGPMPHAGAFVNAYVKAGSDKTCGATAGIFDVHLIAAASANTDGTGTTIFTTKPQLNDTERYDGDATFATSTFAAGDWLAVYYDQAGTNLTDVTLSLAVRYT